VKLALKWKLRKKFWRWVRNGLKDLAESEYLERRIEAGLQSSTEAGHRDPDRASRNSPASKISDSSTNE
jgi:phosphosulfolactate synthase (CoM biosynthesis protein A)